MSASKLQNITGFSNKKQQSTPPLESLPTFGKPSSSPSPSFSSYIFPKIPLSVKALLHAQSFMQIILFIFMMYANEVFTLNILYDAINVRIDLN